jgi:hypothetical protein
MFGWFRLPWRSFHPAGDRSLGNIEPEHQEFAVNSRCAPCWILGHHAEDQLAHFLRSQSLPDRPSDFGDQLPIQTEARPMPSGHRLRRDRDQYLFPSKPKPSRQDPDKFIEYGESWLGTPSLQRYELLTKDQVFKKEATMGAEEPKKRAYQKSDAADQPKVLSHFACGGQRRIFLKSQADGILARGNGCSRKPVRRRGASAMCACQRLISVEFVDNIENVF